MWMASFLSTIYGIHNSLIMDSLDAHQQINGKLWYTYIMEHYSAVKKMIVSFAGKKNG